MASFFHDLQVMSACLMSSLYCWAACDWHQDVMYLWLWSQITAVNSF